MTAGSQDMTRFANLVGADAIRSRWGRGLVDDSQLHAATATCPILHASILSSMADNLIKTNSVSALESPGQGLSDETACSS